MTAQIPSRLAPRSSATTFNDRSETLSFPLLEFVHAVVAGVERRGFHIAASSALKPLWNGEHLSTAQKERRLQLFAEAAGWSVRWKDHGNTALFVRDGDAPAFPLTSES